MSDEKILRPSEASAFDGSSASQSVKQPQFADIAALKINPQSAMISAERVITTLPIRKPGPQEYFRVHPDAEYSGTFLAIEDKADRETYVVDPSLQSEFAAEARPVQIVLGTTRAYPFLWALKLPGADGRTNGWNESAMAAAELARTHWIKINADMGSGAYAVFKALGDLPEPVWPDKTFDELLAIAFKGRVIKDTTHVMFKKLRGLV